MRVLGLSLQEGFVVVVVIVLDNWWEKMRGVKYKCQQPANESAWQLWQ